MAPKKPRRPIPDRYPTGVKSITTLHLHYKTAYAMLRAGERIRRGTIITGYPTMKITTIPHLQITFNRDGTVTIPRYKEVADGILEVQRREKVKDAGAAIRRQWHTQEGIQSEINLLENVSAQLQGTHDSVLTGWIDFNKAQKAAAADYLYALAGTISPNPNRLEKESPKRVAVEQLSGAADLLRKNNASAALYRMVGASNNMNLRKNEVVREAPHVERRRITLTREKFVRDEGLYRLLDAIAQVGTEVKKKGADRNKQRAALLAFSKAAQKRTEPQFNQLGVLASKAAAELTGGKTVPPLRKILKIRKDVFLLASESTILFPDRLEWVRKHRDKPYKRKVIQNQLAFFGANVVYFISRSPRADQIQNMQRFFVDVSLALRGTGVSHIQLEIHRAGELFRAKRYPECKARLLEIAEEMVWTRPAVSRKKK